MKIYLRNLETYEVELHQGELKQLQKKLDKRKIVISETANIGNYANIGDDANIGYKANIGNYANIGDEANIGYYANIGDEANIGNYANIGKIEVFTKEYIYIMLGLLPDEKGYFTMYKAVKEDLTDFYSGKYQYKVGKGDKCKSERNQNTQCGEGWHFTNLWNAIAFASDKPNKIISAKIHIDNILSVYDKVRVNKFSDVKIVNFDFKGKK